MAALDVEPEDDPLPEAKRLCTSTVKLYPVTSVNIRERYTEDTADAVFVDQETKKRLPAHKQLLQVASDVFFRQFSGDWKDSEEMEIPAPIGYNWESFEAVMALVYAEEVEVEESAIPDVYRLAHFYDLREVLSMLVSAIRQWDSYLLETVVKLCVLAQDRPETHTGLGLLHPTLQYIGRHLEQVPAKPVDIVCLSLDTMLMLVQSEDITSTELVLLQVLSQWTNDHADISWKQIKQLYSHIRYGTIPFEGLAECIAAAGHEHLELAVENHQQLMVDRVQANVLQVTPRTSQKEVFKVYRMDPGIAISRPEKKYELSNIQSSPAVAVMYSNREDLEFEITHNVDVKMNEQQAGDYGHRTVLSASHALVCNLSSLTGVGERKTVEVKLGEHDYLLNSTSKLKMIYKRIRVMFSGAGARLHLYPDLESSVTDKTVFKTVNLPYSGPFPWLMTFAVVRGHRYSFVFTHPLGTMHMPFQQ